MPELTGEDRELLELLLEEEGITLSRTIPRRPAGAGGLLSFAQQRLWFVQQLEPESSAYNLPRAFRLRGPLDVSALGRSLSEVFRRHEVLRTTFKTVGGEPVQIVHPARPLEIAQVDLSELTAAERELRVRGLALEEARRPFDLESGPLLRFTLLRLGDAEHVLLSTMHHIVSDEWSAAVLVNEVSALYGAFVGGRPSPLPELPLQYADYAAWQREWLRGPELERQLAYWREQLGGELPRLELPTAGPRPAHQTSNGASQTLALSPGLGEAVRRLSREADATPFIACYAAFTALLQRYTGQRDILVGSPIAGRNWAEVEGLIGFFVNTLVLRADLSGDPDFSTLLRRAREVALGAYAHQNLPFELLVKELQPERSLSLTPLFQVVFALRAAPRERLELPGLGLELSALHLGLESAKFDLFLSVEEVGPDLHATLVYNTDLFDDATAGRMLRHYGRLLEGAVADPTRPVSALPLLTAEERRQLLVEWNRTGRDYPRDSCIHELFERQVERAPDAVALTCGSQQVTYAELNERANRLAHYLIECGVGPDAPVGICLERSAEMVVALLGVLKAGGAYLPLDVEYPPRRLEFLIEDSGARVILADKTTAERLPRGRARVVCCDAEREAIGARPATNPGPSSRHDNLAYCIYTSGSTGTPKGVAVPHRAVLRLVCGADYVRLDETQCVMQLAPLAFDASTLELWGALLHGGRCALYTERRPTAHELGEAIRRHGVRTLWLTASLYNAVIDEAPEELSALEQLLVGGEAVSVPHVLKGVRRLPRTQLINGYGPTEATTFTCCYAVPRDERAWRGGIPIGRPISNTRVYVLDAKLNPAPVGVAGELYVAGDGLARGYFNRPALTAERFTPDPFSSEPGGRLYRTGDLVRYRPDGNLEFLGRIDEQVKVRGFRIEPGEIEAALCAHEGVQEAAVMVREDEPGDKRLAAYVVGGPGATPTPEELRAHLRERLPDYMLPSAFVVLGALPLTPNGKVDRRALPAPAVVGPEPGCDFVAPRTPVEEVVASVWCDVLGVEQVGTGDDFFALGGHSLLAAKIVARLRERFSVDLPLRAIFEGPTVAAIARLVEEQRRAGEGLNMPPLVRAPREQHPPLSFAQQSLWYDDQLVAGGNTAYNVQTTVRLDGPLDTDALGRALNEVVRRHESLRTTFAEVNWQPVQIIAPELCIALPLRDLTGLPEAMREAEALRLATEAAREPFDLARGPLFKVALFRLDKRRHVLALLIHHIVADAWSMGVLIRELAALYEAARRGLPSPLAELPIQYADYARWQREWLRGEVLERHLAYWTRQLAGLTELRFPTDRPRPAAQSFRGAHLQFTLPRSLTAALRQVGRAQGGTLYTVTLAAFKALLHYYSGQEDIVVGTNVANRNRVESEGLIGYFVNVLALRTSLARDPTFGELLARVSDVSLGAFVHQELPFDKVVEALKPERDPSRNPLFQVLFGLNNSPAPNLTLPELTLTGLEVEKGTNLFDLTLFLTDGGPCVAGVLRYSTDLFEAASIARLRALYEVLLTHVAAHPQARLSELRGVLGRADGELKRAAVEDQKKSREQIFRSVRRRPLTEGAESL